MKKILVIIAIVLSLFVGLIGITYSYEYDEVIFPQFTFIGDAIMELSLNDKYIESGIIVTLNEEDISSYVSVDNSLLDTSKVGSYKVKYELNYNGLNEYIYRIVNVREYEKPVIKLNGDDIIYLDINNEYVEPGYTVSDNYDGNLIKDLNITSNLDISKAGEYYIKYIVFDSSGNKTEVKRIIIVK